MAEVHSTTPYASASVPGLLEALDLLVTEGDRPFDEELKIAERLEGEGLVRFDPGSNVSLDGIIDVIVTPSGHDFTCLARRHDNQVWKSTCSFFRTLGIDPNRVDQVVAVMRLYRDA